MNIKHFTLPQTVKRGRSITVVGCSSAADPGRRVKVERNMKADKYRLELKNEENVLM